MSFEGIVGNDKVKELLNKAVLENHIVHSYLFIGIDGIGKKLFAREFARKLLCYNQEETENCISCNLWKSNNHPDYYEIEPENGIIKIEQIRNMQETISEKPITSKKKIYVILESDTMTKEAQNCMLKTLEEPPEYAIIILTSTNETKLLNTIKSRCIKIPFEPIQTTQMEQYIKTKQEEPVIDLFIKASEGSIGKYFLMQQNKEMYEQINKLINTIGKQDIITTLNQTEILYKEKENIQEILEYMNIILYQSKDIKKIHCIAYIEEAKKRILANSNYDMCIDFLLMKMQEEIGN